MADLPSARKPEDEQLRARYREGLWRIVDEAKWCDDYAMCDHVGCESAHRAMETAQAALDLDVAFWPLRSRS